MKRIIIITMTILALTGSMVRAREGEFWNGFGGRNPAELEIDWTCFTFLMFGDRYTTPSPGPDVSITPIEMSKWAIELAYRYSSGIWGLEAGVRNLSATQTRTIKIWDADKNDWQLVSIMDHDEYYAIFGAFEIVMKLLPKLELKTRFGISQDGVDYKCGFRWAITDGTTVMTGYRYWPMDGWYRGPFIGFSAIW